MGICSYIRDPSRIGGELYRKKLWSLWRGSASQALWGLGHHSDGLGQDCYISSASALEILQSCAKLSVFLKTYTAHMDGFVKTILNSMIDNALGHVWFEKAKLIIATNNPIIVICKTYLNQWWRNWWKFRHPCAFFDTEIWILNSKKWFIRRCWTLLTLPLWMRHP